MILLGPGNLGEATVDPVVASKLMAPNGAMDSKLLLEKTAAQLGAVSWHFYGGVSPRCGGGSGLSSPEAALSNEWLDRTLIEYDAISGLRDRLAPGKPLWLTETSQAACGGSPWASGFRDSFRYLNQLGVLAQKGVQVIMHNTLSASDYGLIDQQTLEPRPNYWAAILWHKVMGSIVLEAPQAGISATRIFAHCLPAMNGGVGILVLNPGDAALPIAVGGTGKLWIMQADDLDRGPVTVGGIQPSLSRDGSINGLRSENFREKFLLPARSIAIAAIRNADNDNCQTRIR
jgi:hypothetical protein